MKLYAMTCGQITGELGYLMEGGTGKVTLPIPAYLIVHPKGTALFDTGMHPDCQRDPLARLGQRLTTMFQIHFQPGEEVSGRLEAMDRDPARIDFIISSHLHFDHVGGNALIPNATIIVQKREWQAGIDPEMARLRLQSPRLRFGSARASGGWRIRCLRRRPRRMPTDAWPHAGTSVAEAAPRQRRGRAGGRRLLFLPDAARAAAADQCVRSRRDARFARAPRRA